MSVCLSVRSRISKTYFYFPKLSLHVTRVRGSVLPDDSTLRYVIPVLWMMSFFHIIGHMASGVGNIDVCAVLQRVVKISNVFAKGRHAV